MLAGIIYGLLGLMCIVAAVLQDFFIPVRCAWCGEWQGYKWYGKKVKKGERTDGICRKCAKKHMGVKL